MSHANDFWESTNSRLKNIDFREIKFKNQINKKFSERKKTVNFKKTSNGARACLLDYTILNSIFFRINIFGSSRWHGIR